MKKFLVNTLIATVVMAVYMMAWAVGFNLLWDWFIVPTFGAPDIGLAEAIGISLIITSLTATFRFNDPDLIKRHPSDFFKQLGYYFLFILVALPLVGFIVSWFI